MKCRRTFSAVVYFVMLKFTFSDVDVDFVLVSTPLNPAFIQLDTVDDYPFRGLGYLTQFTVCLRVFMPQEHNQKTVTLVSYESDPRRNGAELSLELDYKQHITGLYVNGLYAGINKAPVPNTWAHICVTWNNGGNVNFYLDGENIASYNDFNVGESIGGIGTLALGPQLVIEGEEPLNYQQREGITGRITHFQFWNKVLTNDAVRKVNRCQLLGNVVRWETSGWKFYGDVKSMRSSAPCLVPQNANLKTRKSGSCTYHLGLSDIDRATSTNLAYRAILVDAFPRVADVMTYCFWLFYTATAPEYFIVKYDYIAGLTGFAFSIFPSSSSSYLQVNDNRYSVPTIPPVNGWTHICVRWAKKKRAGLGHAGGVDLFYGGIHVWKAAITKDTNVFGNGNLTLVEAKDRPHIMPIQSEPTEGFSLKINQFHLWSRHLTAQEIGALAACDTSLVGDLVNWYKVSNRWQFADI